MNLLMIHPAFSIVNRLDCVFRNHSKVKPATEPEQYMQPPTTSEFTPERRFEEQPTTADGKPRVARTMNLHPLILIVETDEDTRLMMKYLLQTWCCEVIETANVEEALRITEMQQPDVILISGRVGQGDTFTTIKRMRELSSSGKTEIVHISDYSEPVIRASVLAAGADDFLVKPIDFGELERIIQRHLKPETGSGKMFL